MSFEGHWSGFKWFNPSLGMVNIIAFFMIEKFILKWVVRLKQEIVTPEVVMVMQVRVFDVQAKINCGLWREIR